MCNDGFLLHRFISIFHILLLSFSSSLSVFVDETQVLAEDGFMRNENKTRSEVNRPAAPDHQSPGSMRLRELLPLDGPGKELWRRMPAAFPLTKVRKSLSVFRQCWGKKENISEVWTQHVDCWSCDWCDWCDAKNKYFFFFFAKYINFDMARNVLVLKLFIEKRESACFRWAIISVYTTVWLMETQLQPPTNSSVWDPKLWWARVLLEGQAAHEKVTKNSKKSQSKSCVDNS